MDLLACDCYPAHSWLSSSSHLSGGGSRLWSQRDGFIFQSVSLVLLVFFWQKVVFLVWPLSTSLFWDVKIIAHINYSSVPYFNCHFLVNLKNCQSKKRVHSPPHQSQRTQQIAWGSEFSKKHKKPFNMQPAHQLCQKAWDLISFLARVWALFQCLRVWVFVSLARIMVRMYFFFFCIREIATLSSKWKYNGIHCCKIHWQVTCHKSLLFSWGAGGWLYFSLSLV